jgi:vancomycin permeability regulator SanA
LFLKLIKKVIIIIIIIIKLENEIIISAIVFGMVRGQPFNEFQKVPTYQFRLLLTEINPSCGWLPM